MQNHEQLTVNLSRQTTAVTVPRDPGRTLQHFQAVETRWVSWPELQDAGVSDPADAVRVLKEHGAVIETIYKDTVTSKWEIHEDAPHYKYLGWHIEANSPTSTASSGGQRMNTEMHVKDVSNKDNEGVEAGKREVAHV